MIPAFIDKDQIPHKPGVYLYKNNKGEIIYVGKAIDLYHRVSSYFRGYEESSSAYFNNRYHDLKTQKLVENIASVETIVVESELEALILEANLIKKHLPLFNIKLTDDKDYLYIKVTDTAFPQIITARKKELEDAKRFFGPFPSSTTVKTTLKRLRRVFPWCQNPPSVVIPSKAPTQVGIPITIGEGIQSRNRSSIPSTTLGAGESGMTRKLKPCFYYHLGLCPGPCAGVISQPEYKKIINRFITFMEGKSDQLIKELEEEMRQESQKQNFEEAQKLKKNLEGILYLLQPNRAQIYLENPNFNETQRQLSLESLQKDLKLPTLPERIECFDISNLAGEQAVGSMVVLTNGEIDKSQYRKFKIKITGKPNDVGMHKEMMERRLKHSEWPLPDLMIIDGGRGQVRAVSELLQQSNLNIPVFGLAKRLEWLYTPEEEIIKLHKSSLSIRLLQKIRDEAHRFAITYHRKLRNKDRFSNLT